MSELVAMFAFSLFSEKNQTRFSKMAMYDSHIFICSMHVSWCTIIIYVLVTYECMILYKLKKKKKKDCFPSR